MRVLIVGPLPPPEGGVATSITNLCRAVAERVDVAVFDSSTHAPVREAGQWSIANVGRALGLAARLRRAVSQRKPDVVQVETGGYLGLLKSAALVLAVAPTPTVLSVHSPYLDEDVRRATAPGRRLIDAAFRRLAAIRVEHAGQREQLVALSRAVSYERVHVIPNMVFPPDEPVLRAPTLQTRLVTVGAVGRRKGTYDLVEALAALRDDGMALTCVALGPEERPGDLAALRARCKALRLDGMVELRGGVGQAEVRAELRAADAFVLPSYAEGLPLAILEAMAHGLPVVATLVGGIGGVLCQPGLPLLQPGDVTALAVDLRRLAVDSALRHACGDANRRRIDTNFSPSAVADRFADLWKRVSVVRQ